MITAAIANDMHDCRCECLQLDKHRPDVFSEKLAADDACPKAGAAPPPKPNAGAVVPKPEEAAELLPKPPNPAGASDSQHGHLRIHHIPNVASAVQFVERSYIQDSPPENAI